jgi:hypothetical protein
MRLKYAIFSMLLPCAGAAAHHSFAAFYNVNETIEIEGEISDIAWRNPHTLFSVRTSGGRVVEVESNSVSVLERMGVNADLLAIGDRVRVAGQPARRSPDQMFGTNFLLPNGTEALFSWSAEPRWSTGTLGDRQVWLSDGQGRDEAGEPNGIFRVWITNVSNPESFPLIKAPKDGYPLTAAAQDARARFDPDTKNPFLGCKAGMPRIMNAITPMELIDRGDRVEINIELYDARRVVNLDPETAADPTPGLLGHSTGHWEGDTLVVTTRHIEWRYFDQSGIPQSADLEIIERFTASADGNRLDYEMAVSDPQVFSRPLTFSKYWTWRPGEEVKPYNCVLES